MKKIKLLTVLVLALSVLLMVGCGEATTEPAASTNELAEAIAPADDYVFQPQTFKIGHALSAESHYQAGCEYMAKRLSELTDGAITLDIYPASQLGGEASMIESLQMGTLDMCLTTTSVLTGFDDNYFIYDTPFLFENDDHVFAVLDGEFGQKLMDNLSNIGLKGLSTWECGWFGFIYNGNPIKEYTDLANTTFRTMEATLTMTWFKALNSNPVPMAWSEVFTALQQGTVDGTILPIPTIYTNSIHTVCDYYSRINITYSPLPLLMSQTVWDGLDPEVRSVIQKAADEARDYEREYAHNVIDEMCASMQDAGCEIITFDDAERQVWIDYMRENVWPDLYATKLISEDAVNEVLSYAK